MRRKIFLVCVILTVALLLARCFRHATGQQMLAKPAVGGNQPGNTKGIWQFTSLQMLSGTTGWAVADGDVLRTTDGGCTWQVVTPPVDRGQSLGVVEDFVDADQAWVAVAQRDATKALALVFQTTDGGQTWHKAEVPQAGGSNVIYWGAITFTDDRHGWLMAVHSQRFCPADLFATTDGGATWSQIASTDDVNKNSGLPFGGEISFRDPATGWVVGNLGSNGSASDNLLYRTQDGGRTWQKQDLRLPAGCADGTLSVQAPPLFFSSREGLLIALCLPQGNETILYTTQDGGQTWQGRPPLHGQGIVDFSNADEGWYWPWEPRNSAYAQVKGKLYHTSDGGKTWTGIEPDQNLKHFLDQGLDVMQLDFINSKTGWAFLNSNGEQIQLLKTTDGGDNWTSVYPR